MKIDKHPIIDEEKILFLNIDAIEFAAKER
jgi:hypothetical protein